MQMVYNSIGVVCACLLIFNGFIGDNNVDARSVRRSYGADDAAMDDRAVEDALVEALFRSSQAKRQMHDPSSLFEQLMQARAGGSGSVAPVGSGSVAPVGSGSIAPVGSGSIAPVGSGSDDSEGSGSGDSEEGGFGPFGHHFGGHRGSHFRKHHHKHGHGGDSDDERRHAGARRRIDSFDDDEK